MMTSRLSRMRGVAVLNRSNLLAALLIGAIVLNVVQWPAIERQPSHIEFRAIGRYDTADIAAITYRECTWCRERYGLYLALGAVAPGARVLIPTPSAYSTDRVTSDEIETRLRVFGRVASIGWVRSDAASGPGFDPTPYIIASGNGGTRGGPWAFAVDPNDLPRDGVRDPDTFLRGVVTGEGAVRSATVREFALIRWPQPRPGISSHPYQELLVETLLLPASVRRGLTG